jgi:transposase
MSNQTQQPEPEFAAFVGIDWADRQHFWACQTPASRPIEQGVLAQTPEAVEEWAMELHRRFGGAPVAVALEQSRGALIFLLAKYPHLILYPVHPTSLANYRKTFRPSGAKGDPSDARLVLDMLVHHRDQLRRLSPDTVETRTLQLLVEQRRKLVNERTRFTNRLTSQLKLYFPQILEWFDAVHSPLVGDLLERWPTLQELQKAKPATVRRFLTQHNCRRQEKIDQRLEQIRQAVPATGDGALLTASRSAVCALVALLRALREAIAAHDEQIEQLAQCHPDFAIFDSLPGAGPVLVPRLIAALGTQRDRYRSAHEIQCYSGIAPVKESSGQQEWVHWRWACPKFLRQTFHEWAGHSVGFSEWARTYYNGQRDSKKEHHAAVRALAFKWIRILFRCWQNRTPYDEAIYLNALRRRQPPLIAPPQPTVDLKLKKRGGFWKITPADA